jgi:hypothetical protein
MGAFKTKLKKNCPGCFVLRKTRLKDESGKGVDFTDTDDFFTDSVFNRFLRNLIHFQVVAVVAVGVVGADVVGAAVDGVVVGANFDKNVKNKMVILFRFLDPSSNLRSLVIFSSLSRVFFYAVKSDLGLVLGCLGNQSFCRMVITSTSHFVNQLLYQLIRLSTSWFCQLDISSTSHFINQSFHKSVISSSSHFIKKSFHQPVISSTGHFIN